MLISHNWLQTFFSEDIPSAEAIAEKLMFHSFEIEGVEKVGEDNVIDVDVLPNRSHDCLSHRGIAREVSVLFDIPFAHDPLTLTPELTPVSKTLSASIEDKKVCRRFTAAVIRGVTVGPSPKWLRERLEAVGQKSINNIVDATNYVMFSIGQPTHVFDLQKLSLKEGGVAVGVREAKINEHITVLGGEPYELLESMSVVVDAVSDTPIAIAGVKGGKVAELTEETVDIVLEAAKFDPVKTRLTAQALKLRTDASTRFENEIPDELPAYGMRALADLIIEIAGGDIEGFFDTGLDQRAPYKLGVSTREVNNVLGTDLQDEDIEKILTQLLFAYSTVNNVVEQVVDEAKKLKGAPYKLGASIRYEAPKLFDCSSFTGYLFAQAGVSIPRMSVDQYVWGEEVAKDDVQVGDLVFSNTGNGHIHYESQEFMHGTKVPEGVDHVGIYIGDNSVIHANMKGGVHITKLDGSNGFKTIVGYRRVVVSNDVRFVVTVPFERLDLRIIEDLIEEIGRVYGYRNIVPQQLTALDRSPEQAAGFIASERAREVLSGEGFSEVYTYSLRHSGDIALANSLATDKDHMRRNIADGIVEALEKSVHIAPLLGLDTVRIYEIGHVFTKYAEEVHIGVGIKPRGNMKNKDEVIKKELEAVHQLLQDALGEDLDDCVYTDETLECVLTTKIGKTVQIREKKKLPIIGSVVYKQFSTYPFALRDIALWVSSEVQADDVKKIIQESAGETLARVDVFDTFEKNEKVSYAYHLVFQSSEKTLTDSEIQESMKNIERALHSLSGFEIR